MRDPRVTLCILFYGDHPELAGRCTGSILERLPEGARHVRDVRLGLNEVSAASRERIECFARVAHEEHGLPVILHDCPENALKYPLMRRMLRTDPVPPAELVMWFDDDSYLCGEPGWWDRVLAAASDHDMIGKHYRRVLEEAQWRWIRRQPWCDPDLGKPRAFRFRRTPSIRFCTGGWWVLRSEVLASHDWPSVELRHRGGDLLLGELLRHRGLRMGEFEEGVRINADEGGRHSKARRRGFDEDPLGDRGGARGRARQEFVCERRVLG